MNTMPLSVPTGIPGLDAVLGSGILQRGVVYLAGLPGTGKTILTQQLLFAAGGRGQTALYFSGMTEPHDRLVEHVQPFAFFDPAQLGHNVQLFNLTSSLQEGPDAAVDTVVQTVRQTDAHLIVIDGFHGLRGLVGGDTRAAQFIYRLGGQLGLLGALLIVAAESNPHADQTSG